jgi:AraC-like DNA-binding protein
VRLGVFDYIVKPITRDRLIVALDGALRRIEQRGDKHGQTLSLLARIHELLPIAEEIFVRAISRGQVLTNLVPLFEYCGVRQPDRWRLTIISSGSLEHDHVRAAVEAIRRKWPCIAGTDPAGRLVCLLPDSGLVDNGPVIDDWREAFREASLAADNGACARRPSEVDALMGKPVPIAALPDEYRRLLAGEHDGLDSSCTRSDLSPLVDALVHERSEEARSLFEALLRRTGPVDTSLQRAEALSALAQLLAGDAVELSNSIDVDAVFHSLAATTRKRRVETQSFNAEELPAPLRRAVAYIQAYFARALQLADVAQESRVSGPYLSQLFSRHLQMGFSDFLATCRVEEAKRLFAEGNRSVKLVSHQVGYHDPNYFSRVFGRITGMAPSAFIESLRLDDA